jgi:hypothetical protein
MPSTRVGVGSGSHLAAACTSAVCAVCHDTPYSRHTSATDRFDAAIAVANFSRSRSVTLARGRISRLVTVNDRRSHSGSQQSRRRVRHHTCTRCPTAGRSLTRLNGRSFTRVENTPHDGHAAAFSTVSITTRTASSSTRCTSTTANSSRPNNNDVGSSILVASLPARCQRQPACRGHEPHPRSDTPLYYEEPAKGGLRASCGHHGCS